MTNAFADVREDAEALADPSSGDPLGEDGGDDDVVSSASYEPADSAKTCEGDNIVRERVNDGVEKKDVTPDSNSSSMGSDRVTNGVGSNRVENTARDDSYQNGSKPGGKPDITSPEKQMVVNDAPSAEKCVASIGDRENETAQNNPEADETTEIPGASDGKEGRVTSADEENLGNEAGIVQASRNPSEDGNGGLDRDEEGSAADNAGSEVQRARDESNAALNVACEALLAARTLNLELEFAHVQTKKGVDLKRCTVCLRRAYLEEDEGVGGSVSGEFGNAASSVASPGKRARSVPRRMGSKLLPRNRASPCLICGSPACPRHSCKDFKKEGITVCDGCSPLFSLEYLVKKCCPAVYSMEAGKDPTEETDGAGGNSSANVKSVAKTVECVAEENNDGDEEGEKEAEEKSDSEEKKDSTKDLIMEQASTENQLSPEEAEALRRRHVHSVLDAYDHALLLLRYSCQFIPGIVSSLRNNTKRNNRIGLGSSATNLVSGITGVAAAATIFTPAGPPLLIASLLFGGGATAASAGSEAVNYNCEPTRLANRIITLNAVVQSIGRLMDVMALNINEGEVGDMGDAEKADDDGGGESFSIVEGEGSCVENSGGKKDGDSDPEPETPTKGGGKGMTAFVSTTGGQASKNASRHSSKVWSRATTNALRAPHLAILTAGALSAFTVALEAREMAVTVRRINAGHPCDKADLLEEIRRELERDCAEGGEKEGGNEVAETRNSRGLYETAELTEAFEWYAAAVTASDAALKGDS